MNVKDKAIHYLNLKPCTKTQLSRYLKSKGYGEDEIVETVRELEKYKYIDDLAYSKMYFEYCFDKGRGISRIKRELSEKGVAYDIIEMALDELENVPDQFEQALMIGREAVSGADVDDLDYDEKQKLKAKIGRRVMSRGFSSEIAYKVINEIL